MPDGSWTYPTGQRGIVEITSPPTTNLMAEWARARRAGLPHTESGSIPLRLNELDQVLEEMLAEPWALENIEKLLEQPADERHLFLLARGYEDGGSYFARLSDTYDDDTYEHVDELTLPEGLTDVWFEGRARRSDDNPDRTFEARLARFQIGTGWRRHTVRINEQQLPSPNVRIAGPDRPPAGGRHPKDRAL